MVIMGLAGLVGRLVLSGDYGVGWSSGKASSDCC